MVSPIACCDAHHAAAPKEDLGVDQLMALLNTELTYQVPHISCQALSEDSDRLPYGEWRRKIVQWCFKVVDHFRLDREVVACALNTFDRYLAAKPLSLSFGDSCPCPACQRSIDGRYFQLTAMTCLYLAMKVHSDNSEEGISPYRRLRLTSFVELSRGQFCAEDITAMEATVLQDLRWKVHPPTPMTAVSYLLRLMPLHGAVPVVARNSYDLVLHVLHELARYLTELSVCLGNIFSEHAASEVAYAAILVSMDLLTYSALPLNVRSAFKHAVVNTSQEAGGTFLTHHDRTIQILQDELRNSFWPDMLMEDCNEADAGHPISMAKDYGLLDMSLLPSPVSVSPAPKSPGTYKDCEVSPISVTRGPY